jgi:fatty-acyl-CoA synthase
LRSSIDATSTFKQKKIDLVREGFNPDVLSDPLYFDDPASGRYVRLDAGLCAALYAGKVRL